MNKHDQNLKMPSLGLDYFLYQVLLSQNKVHIFTLFSTNQQVIIEECI